MLFNDVGKVSYTLLSPLLNRCAQPLEIPLEAWPLWPLIPVRLMACIKLYRESRQPQLHCNRASTSITTQEILQYAQIMAKCGKRGRDEVHTYEADDFVSDDDGSARKSKKTKKAAISSSSASDNKFFEVRLNLLMDVRAEADCP